MISELILQTAAAVIRAIEDQQLTLDEALDSRIPAEIRRTSGHLLINYFRHKRFIETELMKFIHHRPSKKIWYLLVAAASQRFFQTGIAVESAINIAVEVAKKEKADKFVNAILRKIVASPAIYPDAPKQVLPEEILKKWSKYFSALQIEQFAKLFLSEPQFTFRLVRNVNSEKFSEAVPIYAPGNFHFASAPAEAVLNHIALQTGEIYIQDPAAALAPSLVDYTTVKQAIDLCAAPGGKALMLSEKLPLSAKLTVSDISKSRQKLTADNFTIRKRKASIITARPEDLTGSYDLVLADVPCSNTGVFRRRPDCLWRFSRESLNEVRKLQRHILKEAARLTAHGGQLIYATCSIEPEENHLAIKEFLSENDEFTLSVDQQLLPDNQHDGAYAAKLIKTT